MASNDPIVVYDIDIGKARADMTRTERYLVDHIIHDSMMEELRPILASAKAACPKDTGALANSLGIIKRRYRRGTILYYILGPRRKVYRNRKTHEFPSRYAHFVEFGVAVRGIPARPFLRPAWDAASSGFEDRVVARINARLP